jgi:1,4-dihydroxy-6-naphthoate synthase
MACGGSVGENYGPMIVAPRRVTLEDAKKIKIAVPGTLTTAFLTLKLFYPDFETEVVPFDQIIPAVVAGKYDAGLIIHEGQLTYTHENLELILDLGVWWKIKTGLPLPLGGNVIRKDLAPADRTAINAVLRESIRYGLEHRAAGVAHAMPLARGLDTQLADQFIGMYVNDYTLDYGDTGRRAIREFLGQAHAAGLIPAPVELEFVE